MSNQDQTSPAVTITLDIEDHLEDQVGEKRFPEMTRRLLDCLAEHEQRATVFVVGNLTKTDPGLIRDISDDGHEVGLHSFNHAPLHLHNTATFAKKTLDARKALQDLCGQPILGYRAPSFSLTRRCLWVVEELKEIGFLYSSSILPAGNPIYGFPSAPQDPFFWPNTLLELPAPIGKFGPLRLPFLGGIYFRYLPEWLIKRAARRLKGGCAWSYLHPYDIDAEEPFNRPHNAPLWVSLLLWLNRKNALNRFNRFVSGDLLGPPSVPFGDMIERGDFAQAQTVQIQGDDLLYNLP